MFLDQMEWQSNLERSMKPRRRELWQSLIEATLRSIELRGFPATTVSDITDLAGVSRTQFYFLFQDKEECFLAVQEAIFGELETRLRQSNLDGLDWPTTIKEGVDVVMSAFDQEPSFARTLVNESQVAGVAARDQHCRAMARLMPHIERGNDHVTDSRPLPNAVGEMAMGSAMAILSKELHENDRPDFTGLAPTVYFAIVMPFLGPERAIDHVESGYPEATDFIQS